MKDTIEIKKTFLFKTNLIYFPHSFSFNLPFQKLSCWTVNKFAYWSDALNIICLPCTIKIIKSLCILSETFMFAGLKYCKFGWWNHNLNGRKKHQMQAHPIKSLETLVAEVMKEVMSFIEIKLKCSLFTYHILKL